MGNYWSKRSAMIAVGHLRHKDKLPFETAARRARHSISRSNHVLAAHIIQVRNAWNAVSTFRPLREIEAARQDLQHFKIFAPESGRTITDQSPAMSAGAQPAQPIDATQALNRVL